MKYKVVAAFVAGAAFGALAGAFVMKSKYEKESQEAIDSVKQHYRKLEQIKMDREELDKEYETSKTESEQDVDQIKMYDVKAREYLEEHADERLENVSPVEYPDHPYVIKEDEFLDDNPHYSKETVFWYELDEILVDEENDILVDPASLIGHNIQDEIENEKADGTFDGIIYIRNDAISRDFEVYIEEGNFPAGGDYGDD